MVWLSLKVFILLWCLADGLILLNVNRPAIAKCRMVKHIEYSCQLVPVEPPLVGTPETFLKATAEDGNFDISFVVYGEPKPLARHRVSRGRMYNPSMHLEQDFLKACTPYLPSSPLEGALEAHLHFYFSRPKTHFRAGKLAHVLRPGSPKYHCGRKDLDNLVKLVLDSLNGKAYVDDGQVAIIHAAKYYTTGQERIEAGFRLIQNSAM
jgi:Holliday junction resolvase RusA-like endonuclease